MRGRRVLARGRFALRGGTRRTVRLRLARAGRHALRSAASRAAAPHRTATLRGQLVVRQRGLPPRSLLVAVSARRS